MHKPNKEQQNYSFFFDGHLSNLTALETKTVFRES
jgi:hypothetical protein